MLRIRPVPASLRSTRLPRAAVAPPALRTSPSPFLSKSPAWRSQQRSRSSLSTSASRSISQPLAWRPNLARLTRSVRRNSSRPVTQDAGSQAPRSLSDRFKELSRRYGWAAVGVYLGLSVLDFPFCFLAVRLIGPERIGEAEHAIVDGFWNLVGTVLPSMLPQERVKKETVDGGESEGFKANHKDNASIWTQLLLAYGVHKSLIFFRIPLTAAVTPKVVKTLRGWGWNIGRPAKAATS